MSLLIGVTGAAHSGKDSVARYLQEHHGFFQYAFATPIKTAARVLVPPRCRDWMDSEEKKNDKLPGLKVSAREIYQLLGTEFGRDMIADDIWLQHFDAIWWDISHNSDFSGLVISDVRFENEAKHLRSLGGKIIRVTREGLDLSDDFRRHASEAGFDSGLVDVVIANPDTATWEISVQAQVDDFVLKL